MRHPLLVALIIGWGSLLGALAAPQVVAAMFGELWWFGSILISIGTLTTGGIVLRHKPQFPPQQIIWWRGFRTTVLGVIVFTVTCVWLFHSNIPSFPTFARLSWLMALCVINFTAVYVTEP